MTYRKNRKEVQRQRNCLQLLSALFEHGLTAGPLAIGWDSALLTKGDDSLSISQVVLQLITYGEIFGPK